MRDRPQVVCHMVPSVDGRIVTTRWRLPPLLLQEYEATAAALDGDAWIIGRVSMEPYAGRARVPARRQRTKVPRVDFVARRDAASYAIAIDPAGKLRWESGSIDEDHAVAVLTERVPDRHLAFLRETGVSYVFGGRDRIDVPAVLRKLRALLGSGGCSSRAAGRSTGRSSPRTRSTS